MADKKDFTTEMRDKSRKLHEESTKLFDLKLPFVCSNPRLYGHALSDYYFVFQTMENALYEYKNHEHVGPLFFPELQRSSRFEEDLEFYLGSDWRAQAKPSEPARAYCDRILHVAEHYPSFLITYAYSMYLAVLNGGYVIRPKVKKALRLADNRGLAIFDFDGRSEIRKTFKATINSLDISRETKDAIANEPIKLVKMCLKILDNVNHTDQSIEKPSKYIITAIISALIFVRFLVYFVAH